MFDDDFFIDGEEGDYLSGDLCAMGGLVSSHVPVASAPLYIDIETVPDSSRLDTFDLPPLPEIPEEADEDTLPDPSQLLTGAVPSIKQSLESLGVMPATYLQKLAAVEKAGKDRSGVHECITKAGSFKESVLKAHSDRLKLLSTTPEFCSIAAVGWAVGNGDVKGIVVDEENGGEVWSERFILELIWTMVEVHSPIVVYNGLHFDLPVIFARSIILGVASSKMLDLKPWSNDVCDLYYRRFGSAGNTDAKRPGTMKRLAAAYGIPIPAGDTNGGDVYELMKSWEGRMKVLEYVRSDVTILREMHKRLAGYFWA